MNLNIYTDGAARGNPGPAGIGVVVYGERGEVLEKHCAYIGTATNNVAEYRALIARLDLAKKHLPCRVRFHLDSELVVQQMVGAYRVKNEHLLPYFTTAREMLAMFESVDFTYIPREKNKTADGLANVAIDQATGIRPAPQKQ